MHKKTQLALGVATAAMISGFATPANAACTVDGSTVTCTADSTAAEVNAATYTHLTRPTTPNIETDANVTPPDGLVKPSLGLGELKCTRKLNWRSASLPLL